MIPTKYSDSPDEARKRIISVLTEWRKVSEGWCKSTASAVQAMAEAKERKIWEPKYTFKEFCVQACGFSEAWGYQLLNCSKAIGAIGKYLDGSSTLESKSGISLDILNSLTPSHTDPIKELSVPKQASVIANATAKADGKTPTPAQVREAAKEEFEPTEPEGLEEPEKPKDKMGYYLPDEVIALWNRGDEEILALVSHLSKAKKEIKDAYDKSDPLYHGFDAQGWITDLEGVIYKLKCHRPHAVCPVCQGKLSKRCACCKGRGFVGKAYWEGPSVFVEMRKMRETMISKQAA